VPTLEKLQKYIANRGFASRREAERWISEGRVTVDGITAKLGERVGGVQNIAIDGKSIVETAPHISEARLLIYHKPVGEICTRRDPQGRTTPFNHLPLLTQGKWIMVGRLDIQTSGLLLFTNYGALAHSLMHPSFGLERHYLVRVFGQVNEDILKKIKTGVDLEGRSARFNEVTFVGGKGANRWYRVVLTEGRNHEVRKLWYSQGLVVTRLIRVQYGHLYLPKDLKPTEWREVPADDPVVA
jgi:23S rRNA pseudouridine2605 synthase